MNPLLATIFFSCGLFGFADTHAHEQRSLVDAIEIFNVQTADDPIGSAQQPLNEAEVVAAIRFWSDPEAPVSAEMLSSFKKIAETRKLPDNAVFEKLTGYDLGGDYVFDVWSVRIRIQRPNKSSYAFIIRENVVASRTLQEELDRLKSSTGQLPNGERMPGWRRVEDRIKELENRIANK